MSSAAKSIAILSPAILIPALRDAFIKLDPRQLVRNPVIFVTEVVAGARHRAVRTGPGRWGRDAALSGQIALWLWFTVLFATFAESVAEGRGKAAQKAAKRRESTSTPPASVTRSMAAKLAV